MEDKQTAQWNHKNAKENIIKNILKTINLASDKGEFTLQIVIEKNINQETIEYIISRLCELGYGVEFKNPGELIITWFL